MSLARWAFSLRRSLFVRRIRRMLDLGCCGLHHTDVDVYNREDKTHEYTLIKKKLNFSKTAHSKTITGNKYPKESEIQSQK